MESSVNTQAAVSAIQKVLGIDLNDSQAGEIAKIVEGAALQSAVETTRSCSSHAVACCPEDQDMAHKIARRLKQTEDALIANLSALR